MDARIGLAASALTLLAGCGLPGGPGDFDRPATAAGMQSGFVRYYGKCAEPSLDTGLGVYGCPVAAPSSYSFGPDGACTVRAQGVDRQTCRSVAGGCEDLKLHVDCSDIRDAGGLPVSDAGWKLVTRYRATMATVGGDMTIVDAVVDVDLETDDGELRFDGTPVNEFVAKAYGAAAASGRAPLSVQVLDAKIVDPAGQPFAVMGFAAG